MDDTRTRLEAEGWIRRTTTDEPRLSELVQTYRALGFEVRVEPVGAGDLGECSACIQAEPDRYRTIFTRPADGGSQDDHPFADTKEGDR